MLGVPTMIVALLEAQEAQPRDLGSLELVAAGGSMVQPELIRRAQRVFGCRFQTVYGQTECSPLITQTGDDDGFEDLCETVGQPLPQTAVSIRDPVTHALAPLGSVGEICARS